jgi:hypothetical protein
MFREAELKIKAPFVPIDHRLNKHFATSPDETKLTPDEIIFPFFEAMPKLAKVNPKPEGRPIFATRRWSCSRRAFG